MDDVKLHLVSHVHWDPMWYLPFEKYRIRLVRLMKKLLDILDNDEEYLYFMFDGQVSAIDDYLEIMPMDEERIRKHVKNGRLLVGPWYIQPEEFMISGESHIRNLMLGHRRGKELGGEVMNVSYLCDMVGHIAQMPQIVKGFGIDSFAGVRGILDGKDRVHSEFIWESPDGSAVLLKVMPFGYHNIIPDDPEGFIQKVQEMKQSLLPFATTEYILIMQGGDHLEPVAEIPRLIKEYNKRVGREELIHTTLPQHISCIKKSAPALKTYRGELRSTYRSSILTGILSTRMEVKLANEKITEGLEKWAEPFSAINKMLGLPYPGQFIDYAWKKQLKNAFHDCIYGAHVDSVTPDILNDYKRATEVIEWIVGDALHNITLNIDTSGKEINVTLFNPSSWKRKNVVADFELFFEEERPVREFIAEGPDGSILPLQLNSVKKIKKFTDFSANMWKYRRGKDGYLYNLSVFIPLIPAMGYANIKLQRPKVANLEERIKYYTMVESFKKDTDLKVTFNGCENKYLKLLIKDDGLLDILDKQTGTWYRDMHFFEDSGDAGDQYNFSPPVENRIILSKGCRARVALVSSGPLEVKYMVETSLELPRHGNGIMSRSEETIANRITSFITLKSMSRVIEFKTTIDNRSKDHRLRVVFPTAIPCRECASGSQFYVIERPTAFVNDPASHERQHGNYPHRLFVDISDREKGVAFLDRGIPEYQASPEGDLFITLLRCTGYLSLDTLPERTYGHAGPPIQTPKAQEIGEHTFEYGLYFHPGDWKRGQSYRYSEEFYSPVKAVQGDAHDGTLPSTLSFLEADCEGIVLSALKKGSKENEYIVRVYNVLDEDREFCLKLFKPVGRAFRTNLNEDRLEELAVNSDGIPIKVRPHEIFTISVEL